MGKSWCFMHCIACGETISRGSFGVCSAYYGLFWYDSTEKEIKRVIKRKESSTSFIVILRPSSSLMLESLYIKVQGIDKSESDIFLRLDCLV